MPTPGTTYKKLSVNEWIEISNLAEQGTPVKTIATTFGVNMSVIYAGLKARGIIVGGGAAAIAKEAASREAEILISKIKDSKEKHYRYNQALMQLMMQSIIEASKKNRVGAILDEVKAYKLALSAIKDGTVNAWKILGLDKDNVDFDKELPDLPIRELTEREVQAIRDRQEAEDELDDLSSLPEEIDDEIEVAEEGDKDMSF